MITIEMLTEAVYSFMGLAALVVVLTQLFKNWSENASWYKKAKESGKKWADHMLAFIASFICNGIVLGIGLYFGIGIFTAFCLTCLSSWLLFIGSFICCAFVANGEWSYEFMQKILEWIKLLPASVTKKNKNIIEHNCEEDEA